MAELRRGGQGTAAESQRSATRAVNSLLEVGGGGVTAITEIGAVDGPQGRSVHLGRV